MGLIDILDYREYESARFLDQLGNSLEKTGFVMIQNIGIDDSINQLRDQSRIFFEESNSDQREMCHGPHTKGERGFVSEGEETAIGFTAPDKKCFFGYGRQDHVLYPQNIWPSKKQFPKFRDTCLSTYVLVEQKAFSILAKIAHFCDIDPATLVNETRGGNSVQRLNYYPASGGFAREHKDSNYITLLHNPGKGLHVRIQDEWYAPQIPLNTTIINIGEKLEKRTSGKLPATWHYAKVPANMDQPRYNEPFFLHPRDSVELFPGLTAGEFMREHLDGRYTG